MSKCVTILKGSIKILKGPTLKGVKRNPGRIRNKTITILESTNDKNIEIWNKNNSIHARELVKKCNENVDDIKKILHLLFEMGYYMRGWKVLTSSEILPIFKKDKNIYYFLYQTLADKLFA